MSAKKGSAFERQICKDLSRWWSNGKRDDIFWRSSQSGGRATQRAKSGKKTFGSYGDIAAVDPIGQPLLSVLTIELKRGRSHGCLADLLDVTMKARKRAFQEALLQAIYASELAQSRSWALIFRRDCKEAVICFELDIAKAVLPRLLFCNRAVFRVGLDNRAVVFIAMSLASFLKLADPASFLRLSR